MLAAAVLAVVLALPLSAQAETDNAWTLNDGQSYVHLADAVEAAGTTKSTITLNKDEYVGAGTVVKADQDITIDLQGNTFIIDGTVGSSGTETNAFQLLKGSTVVIKNGTIKVGNAARILQTYNNLTLEDLTLDASNPTKYNVSLVCSFNNGTVAINGNTTIIPQSGKGAFDVYYWPNGGYDAVSVTVNTTGTIGGTIEYGSDGTSTGLQNIGTKASLVINSGTFDSNLYTYYLGGNAANVTVNGGTFQSATTANNDSYTKYAAQTSAVHVVDGVSYVHAEPSFTEATEVWNADNTKVSVSRECTICGTVESVTDADATLASVTLPTTEAEGSYNYEATFKLGSSDYTAKKSVAIPALKADVDDETTANSDDTLRGELNALLTSGTASEDLQKAVIAAAEAGETLEVKAVVEEASTDDASAIAEKIEELGLTAGPAYDVTVKVFDAQDNEVAELNNLSKPIYVALDISDLEDAEKGKVRDFTVVRVHEGEVSVIDSADTYVSEDGDTLYVKSDKFSGYGVAYEDVDPTPVTMYRLYNPNSGEHFYTSNVVEKNVLVTVGWKYEGIAWTAPSMSATPVYRLYSGTDHHYTTSVVERDYLVSVGWTDEGIGWYSDDLEGVAVYRQFNPNVDPAALRNNSGSHNYTCDQAENDALVSLGWTAEGIGWYGMADTEAED
jgi:hypothetical protein